MTRKSNQAAKLSLISMAALLILLAAVFTAAQNHRRNASAASVEPMQPAVQNMESAVSPEEVSAFSGQPYAVIDGNVPRFTEAEITDDSYEFYSQLDSLGRCSVAVACIGRDLMPTEKREGIGQIKPTGWHTVKYDFVDGKYLYNRCHLIGFQLTGENANSKNLITGTRYLNVEGMLPFENMVADFIKETGCHVMYRVTPVFSGDELLARGVQIEALSVEDNGEGICFHVYCYNVQPGVVIDYATGLSRLEEELSDVSEVSASSAGSDEQGEYVINVRSMKFHLPDCGSLTKANPENLQSFSGGREALIEEGYSPCGSCNP